MLRIQSQNQKVSNRQEGGFNLLTRTGLSNGIQANVFAGLTGSSLWTSPVGTLDVSPPCSTGHFACISNPVAKLITFYDATGASVGTFQSERNKDRVLVQISASINDVLQWDATGFTLSFYNRPGKISLPWNIADYPGEILVQVAMSDSGQVVYVCTTREEDPDIAKIYRYTVSDKLTLSSLAFYSATTTSTAYSASELNSNPPTGAAACRMLLFGENALVLTDSNDDRARLITFAPSNNLVTPSSFRISFGTDPTFDLGGLRASQFTVASHYLVIGDQNGLVYIWDIETDIAKNKLAKQAPVFIGSVRDEVVVSKSKLAGLIDKNRLHLFREEATPTSTTISTEWAQNVTASDNYIVCAGDEETLRVFQVDPTTKTGKVAMTVKRTHAVDSFTRVAMYNNTVVASEFSGVNLLEAWNVATGTKLYSVSSGIDSNLYIGKIAPLALSSSVTVVPSNTPSVPSTRSLDNLFAVPEWGNRFKEVRLQ